MAGPTISVLFLRHIVNCFELTGRPRAPMLAEFGLHPSLLDDREATIPLAQFLQLLEHAARCSANPHFGLQSGRLAGSDSLGPLSFLFLSAPTLGDAFRSFVRYLDTMQQGVRNAFAVESGRAMFEYSILDPSFGMRRQDAEYSIGATYTLAKNYCGGQLELAEVCFEHPRAVAYSRYRDFFNCDVFFEQPRNSITFDAAILNQPGKILSADLFPILVDHLQRKAAAQCDPADLLGMLENWLASADISRPLGLEDGALEVGCSPKKIQRHLSQRGATWRGLLHKRRIAAAERLLLESHRSVADVALATGYAESASFIRAFKAASGMTPARYRADRGGSARRIP